MKSAIEFIKKLWKRLEHIVIDFCQILALILAFSAISAVLHRAHLSKEHIAIFESVHFWGSIILMLLFCFFTILNLIKEGAEEYKGRKGEGGSHD